MINLKFIFLIFAYLICHTHAFSQNHWSKLYDIAKASDAGWKLISVGEYYYIMAANICSPNSNFCTGLIKIDQQGNVIWKQIIDSISPSNLNCMVTDGNFIFLGVTHDNDFLYNFRLLKFDLNGNLIKEKIYPNYPVQRFIRTISVNKNKIYANILYWHDPFKSGNDSAQIWTFDTDFNEISKFSHTDKNFYETLFNFEATPGFIVNRIARPYYGEAIRIYEENLASKEYIDQTMKKLGGFKMGPFELMDFIGHDVNYAVTESVWTAFYFEPKYKPSLSQKRLVEAAYLGRKSGRGFYNYEDVSHESKDIELDLEKSTMIFERIICMLIHEAADALYLEIASKEDIETAMCKGVNYPKGLLHWADEIGIEKCVSILNYYYNLYHEERYRCSAILQMMAKSKITFFNHNLSVCL